MDENEMATSSPTNTERLRAHLTVNGLAAALLSAWEETENSATAQKELMAALVNFYFPEQTGNDEVKVK